MTSLSGLPRKLQHIFLAGTNVNCALLSVLSSSNESQYSALNLEEVFNDIRYT